MNDSIIKFYMICNRLKEKIRTGWQEIEISADRLESVAEHIYGCLILAIAMDSEYHLNLDMYKVLKMLTLHELEETIMKDFTIRDNITREQKNELGRKCVIEVTDGLIKQNEIVALLDEFNAHQTKESIFCYHIDKIECDFQAKLYDLKGYFKLEKALEDIQYYGEKGNAIKEKVRTASDVWIEYDKQLYEDDQMFHTLIEDIQGLQQDQN
ncbi:MAG: HD domain-containing protein [Clostridia bacterium]|nr:HD domain-containing protein [Clostridia bacterium]